MYRIVKKTDVNRGYSPYRGKTCIMAGITPGKIYTDIEEVKKDVARLNSINPVGFIVIDQYNREVQCEG